MSARRPFIVAELSANHLGSRRRAHLLVEAAAEAGADAIKLQTWTPGTMCVDPTIPAPAPWTGSLAALYEQCHTPWRWHQALFDHARDLGMEAFSAAFDPESVDFLETLGVKRHKVASNEITDLPLIRAMARTGKPIIFSAGCATHKELNEAAAAAIAEPGCLKDFTVLQCTAAYPAPVERANLRRMVTFREEYGCRVGLSDHTQGIAVAIAAAALWADYIEKHLTLARADGGPDAAFSLEPSEFEAMVLACRTAAVATEDGVPHRFDESLRRSLWVVQHTDKGAALDLGVNVRTARPAMGLPCSTDLRGRVAARDLEPGQPLLAEDLA